MQIPVQIEINGKTLLGLFQMPKNELKAVVILCYGLNGTRVEQHRMAQKMAVRCSENQIMFVRFDYRNQGISDGTFEFISIKDKEVDIDNIVNFVRGCINDVNIPIYLLGYSDGAKIATTVASKRNDIAGIIFWNPVFKFSQNKKVIEGINSPKIFLNKELKILYQKLLGLRLNINVLREMKNDKTCLLLEKYDKRILYIFGSNDRFTKEMSENIEKFNFFHKNINEVAMVNGASHIFNRTYFEEEVFKFTIEWIAHNFG